jgi:hypothetical protein
MDHGSIPPPQQMFQMITGYWVTQIVGTLARLGIADSLADGPRTSGELAQGKELAAGPLYRLLRAAAMLGALKESPRDRFQLTPVGETLRANVPGSMRDFAIAQSAPGHWLPWARLEDAVRTGERTTKAVLGTEIWDWYAAHPAEAAAFSGAMANLAALVADDVVRAVDLAGKRVVDVGGAHGTLLARVLQGAAGATGVLMDLPHVIEGARTAVAAQGLAQRMECVGGDFFERVPEADAFLLKQVLHDWDDAQCARILTNCARAARPGARLLAVEMVIADDGRPGPAPLMDLNMLVMLPGRERTRAEYAALLQGAGWKLSRELPLRGGFDLLEAVRA